MSRPARGGPTVAAALAAVVLTSCGAPTSSPAEPIATVPYALSSPSAATEAGPAPSPSPGPHVFLVRDDVLVAATAPPEGRDARETAVRALARLVVGPTDRERTSGLSTALGPDARVSLVNLSTGLATVDVRAGGQQPGAGRLPLAVGQVVLTLTSIAGIDAVLLTADGAAIAAPLPGGALTEQPLRARDYAELSALSPTPWPGG